MTKVLDQHLFQYYNRNDGLRITDLHQGIVWGTQTPETERDERLINRFDYDGDYGTVLNRSLMHAAVGYHLTVHGTGGQIDRKRGVKGKSVAVRVEIGGRRIIQKKHTIRIQFTYIIADPLHN